MVRELVASSGSNKENGALVNYVLAHSRIRCGALTSLTTRSSWASKSNVRSATTTPSTTWKQEDFWGINAFFKGIKSEEVRKENANGLEVVDHTEVRDEPTDA